MCAETAAHQDRANQTQAEARQYELHTLLHHQALDAARLGSERETDADLVGPLFHCVRDQSIEADGATSIARPANVASTTTEKRSRVNERATTSVNSRASEIG